MRIYTKFIPDRLNVNPIDFRINFGKEIHVIIIAPFIRAV